MEELIVVAVCLVINGFLSAFEMAFVSVQKSELKKLARKGHTNAANILSLRDNPERTLSVIQVGITLVGAIAAAVGGAGASDLIEPYLIKTYSLSENSAELIGILFVVIPLTYLSVVVGELAPKTLALRNPTRIVLSGAKIVILADRILTPMITFLEWSTKTLLKSLFPNSIKVDSDSKGSVELDHLSPLHQQFVLNMVNIESKKVRDILIPWTQVNHISAANTIEEVAQAVLMFGHTRLPVLGDKKILGVLHTKEFMALRDSGETHWQQIIRPCIFVQLGESSLRVLRMMQEKHNHLAIVGQFSEPIGIVTLEDVIEEIVGDIYDEDDDGRVRKIFAARRKKRLY